MEELVLPQAQKHNSQTSRRYLACGSLIDLWEVVRHGSVADVDVALASLKKSGGNINSRNAFGLTPLHIATWRNHVPIVRRLLEAGADPNAKDGESGWSSLHRALHFGHLAVASVLLQSGASIILEDSKCRTPVDLLSGPVSQTNGNGENSATEVFSWGSGVNYQLGTGNAHIQKLPCKLDSLHGSCIKSTSAAKFHSVALTACGEVYTWGFGRGGRLGHPEFDIHSGQAAVITPRLVTFGLGARRVKAIAAAKHHTVVATERGDVFTWGSNREGQLGYTSVDTQPTPRRVSLLRSRIVAVAAANKHTAVVSESGEVFTWGCNEDAQLGYGTSNSASNYTPRVVEYLKGKVLVKVAASKCHTVVLGADGEVFTWGHKLVNPRRVVISRSTKKCGNTPLKFYYNGKHHHVTAIAAGMVHSVAVTHDGALYYWASSDPDLLCQQLYSFSGQPIVSISSGKYWTAAVLASGNVYLWDEKKKKGEPPFSTRLHGVKKATSVSVGETHLLIINSLYHPIYPPSIINNPKKLKTQFRDEMDEFDENFVCNRLKDEDALTDIQNDDAEIKLVPSLKFICEKVAGECLVEPRNSIQMLEIADSLQADDLMKYCKEIAIRNLDYILTVSTHTVASASLDILANLEKFLDLKSSEPWSYRRLPIATATIPVILNGEEDSGLELLKSRINNVRKPALNRESAHILDGIFNPNEYTSQDVCKQVRALRKKLQQIEVLEGKLMKGNLLDGQQIAKVQMRPLLERSLADLGVQLETISGGVSSLPDGKVCKRVEASRKQRRRRKQKAKEGEQVAGDIGIVNLNAMDGFVDMKVSQIEHEENHVASEGTEAKQVTTTCCTAHDFIDGSKEGSSLSRRTKKKNRKGGLSLFLSGALDDVPEDVTPSPPTPKNEGPAWGGAKIQTMSASLREIQNEQSKTKGGNPTRSKDLFELSPEEKNDTKISLASFLTSKPIPVVPAQISQPSNGNKATPPWVGSGTPPSCSRPSLKDIQLQQGKKLQGLSISPQQRTTGFFIASAQDSPSDSAGSNRWFRPEVEPTSSIRAIQIEERAVKDLKRFYSSVKIVKNRS